MKKSEFFENLNFYAIFILGFRRITKHEGRNFCPMNMVIEAGLANLRQFSFFHRDIEFHNISYHCH